MDIIMDARSPVLVAVDVVDQEYLMVVESLFEEHQMMIEVSDSEHQMTVESFHEEYQMTVDMAADSYDPADRDEYTGSYEVTPSQRAQILETSGLIMNRNVTINPIPRNYGLITWDGATLMVS